MSLLTLNVKHGRTLAEAQAQLDSAVNEARSKLGTMLQRVDWAPDRRSVKLFGPGVEVGMRVDEQEVHVVADVAFLGRLLANPLAAALKQIVTDRFQKQLPGK